MVVDFLTLVQHYDLGLVTEETIVINYGQETLERIIEFLTDPFNYVLGG